MRYRSGATFSNAAAFVMCACFSVSTARNMYAQGQPTVGQEQQRELAARINSSEWKVRRAALTDIASIIPGKRQPGLVAAVVLELERLNGLPDIGAKEVPRNSDDEEAWTYYADIVSVVSGSSDPVAIRPLADALGMGRPAVDALARFGERAVPDILKAVDRHTAPDFRYMAIYTFRLMLEQHTPLGAQSRLAISGLVRQHLTGRQFFRQVIQAIDVAGLLKDSGAIRMVSMIAAANTAEEVGLTIVDRAILKIEPFEIVRKEAKTVLGRSKWSSTDVRTERGFRSFGAR